MTDGFGSITWWGFSPSLDLQDIYLTMKDGKLEEDEAGELNILLVGAGDCRHVLKTMARGYKHQQIKINFYIVESSLELYARDLLLMSLILESPQRIGLQEKTEMFLELFGNTLIREQSMQYVNKMSDLFIKMVTDFDYLEKTFPLFDMSLLKFKERDMLEGIFKFWRDPNTDVFDVKKAWDLRLRQYLGVRYDAIPNVFDWDYSMKLVDKGAGIITGQLYKRWRHTGIGFDLREGTYETPNKTLASGLIFKHDGERMTRRGYWGDIIVSPFISFGIECEKQEFFKKSNQMYTSSSLQVSEYNITSVIHELTHKEKYVPPKKEDKPQQTSATLTEISEEEEEEMAAENIQGNSQGDEAANAMDRKFEPMILENFKIYFMPLMCLPDLHKKSRYQDLFHMVYMSNSMVHRLNKDLTATFHDEACLVLETAKFMLDLKKDQIQDYVRRVTSMAQDAGCKPRGTVNEEQDAILKFLFKREDTQETNS